jgi:uncharacterized protein (DUF1501 family)
VELGVANQVTSFTVLGRTLSGNNDGSDHGWAACTSCWAALPKGGRYYGKAPVVASDGPRDVGQSFTNHDLDRTIRGHAGQLDWGLKTPTC